MIGTDAAGHRHCHPIPKIPGEQRLTRHKPTIATNDLANVAVIQATIAGQDDWPTRKGNVMIDDMGDHREIEIKDRNAKATIVTRKKADKTKIGEIAASLSGSVVKVLVERGASVSKGTPLIITEAMKMETTLSAPIDGIVSSIHVNAGERVESGDCLLEISTQV